VTRIEACFWAIFASVVIGLASANVRPQGDCGEYVLMASAFAHHLTPEIRDVDAAWVAASEPRIARLMERVQAGMAAHDPVLLGSIHRTDDGRYYSFHFWLYSLLAAPFVWPLNLLGTTPLLALTSLNAAASSRRSSSSTDGAESRPARTFLTPGPQA
jgi:hypothetical protein